MQSLGSLIEEEAAALVGVKWLEGGRDTDSGIDCLGSVLLSVFRATGIALPDPVLTDSRWESWRDLILHVEAKDRLPGDLVVIGVYPPFDKVDHVGILASCRQRVWHASIGMSVLCAPVQTLRVLGYRRFKPSAFGFSC